MLSKSTRAKRRHNAVFYGLAACIRSVAVDQTHGNRFYLVTLQVEPGRCIHREARGDIELRREVRSLREQCRQIAAGPALNAARCPLSRPQMRLRQRLQRRFPRFRPKPGGC